MIAYSNWKQRNTDDYTARDPIFSYMGRDKCHRIHRLAEEIAAKVTSGVLSGVTPIVR
jgi:hypothetical protein